MPIRFLGWLRGRVSCGVGAVWRFRNARSIVGLRGVMAAVQVQKGCCGWGRSIVKRRTGVDLYVPQERPENEAMTAVESPHSAVIAPFSGLS